MTALLVALQAVFYLPALLGHGGMWQLPPAGFETHPLLNAFISEPWGQQFVWPYLEAERAAWLSGRFPLWNPLVAGGAPFLANIQIGALSPFVIAQSLLVAGFGADVLLLARNAVAGLAAYCLLRLWGVSPLGGFVTALGLTFFGWVNQYLQVPPLHSLLLFPTTLLAVEAYRRRQSARRWVALVAVFSVVFLTGQPELVVFQLLFAGGYILWMLGASRPPDQVGQVGRMGLVLGVAGAGAAAGGVAASAVLPFLEYWPHTWHAHFATFGKMHLDARMLGLEITPIIFQWTLAPLFGEFPVRPDQAVPYLAAMGDALPIYKRYLVPMPPNAIGIGLAVPVVAALLRLRRLSRPMVYAAAVVAVGWAVVYGVGPLARLGWLPGFAAFANLRWVTLFTEVFLMFLAGAGVDVLLRRVRPARAPAHPSGHPAGHLAGATVLPFGVVVVALLCGPIAMMAAHRVVPFPDLLPLAVAAIFTLLVAYGGVALLSWRGRRWAAAWPAILFLEVFLYQYLPAPVRYPHPLRHVAELAEMLDGVDLRGRIGMLPQTVNSNIGMLLGFSDVGNFDGLQIGSRVEFLRRGRGLTEDKFSMKTLTNPAFVGPQVGEMGDGEMGKVWNMLGLRYLVAPVEPPLRMPETARGTWDVPTMLAGSAVHAPQPSFVGPVSAVAQSAESIDGPPTEARSSLFQHAPSRVDLSVRAPRTMPVFTAFATLLKPDRERLHNGVSDGDGSDGMGLALLMRDASGERLVFARQFPPAVGASAPRWRRVPVDLARWKGQEITLSWVALPGARGDERFDYGAWGSLHWSDGRPDYQRPLRLVARSRHLRLYENPNALPRAFLTDSPASTRGAPLLVFDAAPDRVRIVVPEGGVEGMGGAGRRYVVLTDTALPGWRAYLDGAETPIEPVLGDVNPGLFRAVALPEDAGAPLLEAVGARDRDAVRLLGALEFVYQPVAFRIGLWVTIGALGTLFSCVLLTPKID